MTSSVDNINNGHSSVPEVKDGSHLTAETEKAVEPSAMEGGLRALEMKYMELLEKRIADLEAKLKDVEKVRLHVRSDEYLLTQIGQEERC